MAITTSSNEGRIQKMAGVSKLEDLTDGEMEEIDKVGRGVHFRSYAVSFCSAARCTGLIGRCT